MFIYNIYPTPKMSKKVLLEEEEDTQYFLVNHKFSFFLKLSSG